MSPFDTFMFDWFGDTLFNVLLFNIVLVGPLLRSRAGRGEHLASWPQVVLYTALLSAGCDSSTTHWPAASCGRSAGFCSAGSCNSRSRALPIA